MTTNSAEPLPAPIAINKEIFDNLEHEWNNELTPIERLAMLEIAFHRLNIRHQALKVRNGFLIGVLAVVTLLGFWLICSQ